MKPCAAAPAAPTGLKATAASSSSITLAWTAVATPANCTVAYNVYRSTSATFTASSANQLATGISAASYADSTVAAKTKYTYQVKASDSFGSSAASAAASATTPAAPAVPAIACHVTYQMLGQWPGGFQGAITIQNTGTTALSSWTLGFSFPSGQTINNAWNTNASQKAAAVTMTNMSYNGTIAPGASQTGIGFIGVWSTANNNPTTFTVNGVVCK